MLDLTVLRPIAGFSSARADSSRFPEAIGNGFRIAATVKDCHYINLRSGHLIVNSKRKPPDQFALEAKNSLVNHGRILESGKFRINGGQKTIPRSKPLVVVETRGLNKVRAGFNPKYDVH